MNLLWMTDIHFDHLSPQQRADFLTRLSETNAHAALLGGDFSCAPQMREDLLALRTHLPMPLHFVLGNHDAYEGSLAEARETARTLSRETPGLSFLEEVGYSPLSEDVALVGHGCWGDFGAGLLTSWLPMNDFSLIREFKALNPAECRALMERLGEEAARYLGRFCREAARRYPKVVVLTHAVPFAETCHNEIRPDPYSLPFFCCRWAGDAILEVARDFPEVEFTVLSGHTHAPADRRILPNVRSRVQGAEYGIPEYEMVEI